jgi:hypothetical protein
MELDLKSLFGLHVHSCTNWLKVLSSEMDQAEVRLIR